MFSSKDAENVARNFLREYDPDMIYSSIDDLTQVFKSYYLDGFDDGYRDRESEFDLGD